MPLAHQTVRAITAAAGEIMRGLPLDVSSRGFWARHGMPRIAERRDILARAYALASASETLRESPPGTTLAELFAGTAYEVVGGVGGPLETTGLDVFGRVAGRQAGGGTGFRSASVELGWGDTRSDAIAGIQTAVSDQYPFMFPGGLSVMAGSLTLS